MQWNKKYNYPTSSRTTEGGIRRYLLGEKKLPSVTSILDATKSEEDKAALANWRERTGHKEAEAITKAASSRGSQMHNYLESFLLGRENLTFFDDKEQYKMMAKKIIEKGLNNRLEEIYGTECTLYYPEILQQALTFSWGQADDMVNVSRVGKERLFTCLRVHGYQGVF